MSAPSPAPRRVKAPSWLDLRLVLGIVLVIGSVLAGAFVVSRAHRTIRVLAARQDLAAGTTVHAAELTFVSVKLPDHGRHVYLRDRSKAVGRTLNRPLAAGELLPAAALGTVHSRTTLSVPLAADDAPSLHAGQRIELWVSTRSCPATVLAADVTVQAVHQARGTSFASGGGQDVVLSVSPQLAGRIVRALSQQDARVRAGVLSGPRPVSPAAAPAATCTESPANS